LSTIASVRAASAVSQISAALLFGYDGDFPVSPTTRDTFFELQTKLNRSLCGTMAARDQVVRFLCSKDEN
jgi:hypothetical protein